MIPWLLVSELLSVADKPLSTLIRDRESAFPCSGEINYQVVAAAEAMRNIEAYFSAENPVIDRTDGISLEFDQWRLNLRASNTEPLLRLNVESRGDPAMMVSRVAEVERLLGLGQGS